MAVTDEGEVLSEVEGRIEDGAAISETEKPVLVGGKTDLGEAKTLNLTTSGEVRVAPNEVEGLIADGDDVGGIKPVLVGGRYYDGFEFLARPINSADDGDVLSKVEGRTDDGAAISGTEKPVLVGGKTELGDAKTLNMTTDGKVRVAPPEVQGLLGDGDPTSGTEKPVLVGGKDTNGDAQTMSVTTAGRVETSSEVEGKYVVGGELPTNPSAEKPVIIGGSNPSNNAQTIKVSDTGNVFVEGGVVEGNSLFNNRPVIIGGNNGGNARTINVTAEGDVRSEVEGRVDDGAAISGTEKPVLVGGKTSGGNAETLSVTADGKLSIDDSESRIISAYRTFDNLAGTTLAIGGDLTEGTTGLVTLTDRTGFGATETDNYIRIGGEIIKYNLTGATGNQINIVERGVFATTDANHTDGSNVGELYDSGVLMLDTYTQVITKIQGDQNFAMKFIWYNDLPAIDSNIIRSLTPLYFSTTGYDFLSAPAFGPYVRYTLAPSGGVTTTQLFFETEFTRVAVHPQLLTLNSGLFGSMVSVATRSVTVGKQPDGDYVNLPADGSAFSDPTPLAADAEYISGWTDTDGFNSVEIFIRASHVSAVDGIIVEFSDDIQGDQTVRGSLYFTFHAVDVAKGFRVIYVTPSLDGFRVRYINGGTQQMDFYIEATCRINGNAQSFTASNELLTNTLASNRGMTVNTRQNVGDATSWFMLVDLNDTTTFPHKQNTGIVIDWISLSVDIGVDSDGTLDVGVVTELDATDGSVVFFITRIGSETQGNKEKFYSWKEI